MVNRILIDLENWSYSCPCGVVALSNDEILSDYCDSAEDYANFFDEIKERIDYDTELIVHVKAEDMESCISIVRDIKTAFDKAAEYAAKKTGRKQSDADECPEDYLPF